MVITKLTETMIQNPISSNFFFPNSLIVQIIHYTCIFLVNFISYSYLIIKAFKVLCYSKLTIAWFPMINPYKWPFSIIYQLTRPYFSFWSKILPNLRLETSALEISGIVGVEVLNSLGYFCVRILQILILTLEDTEKFLAIQN
jgi:uncharacterized protein YggT (Ycf19 family)